MAFKGATKTQKTFKEGPNLLFVRYAQDHFMHIPFCPHQRGKNSYKLK